MTPYFETEEDNISPIIDSTSPSYPKCSVDNNNDTSPNISPSVDCTSSINVECSVDNNNDTLYLNSSSSIDCSSSISVECSVDNNNDTLHVYRNFSPSIDCSSSISIECSVDNKNDTLYRNSSSSIDCSSSISIECPVDNNDDTFCSNIYSNNAILSDDESQVPMTDLKIGTLNVCGLKTRLNYPEFVELIQKFSIVCLSETKVDKYDMFDVPNYTFFSKPRSEKVKRKSGGLGFFIKNSIIDKVTTVQSDCEYIYWIKIHSVVENDDIWLGSMYIPPDGSKYFNDDELFSLENDISEKKSKSDYVIITGDANAYTSNLPDYIEIDDSLSNILELDEETLSSFNEYENLKTLNIPIDRTSKCTKINSRGRRLLDTCKNNNIYILNGRYGNDKLVGNFTFKDSSEIDYTICFLGILRLLTNFEIIELDPLFSDGHALQTFDLTILSANSHISSENVTQNIKETAKYTWHEQNKNVFVRNLNPDLINEITTALDNAPQSNFKTFINEISTKISDIFANSAEKSLQKKQLGNASQNHKLPWYGPQCTNARNKYNVARKTYQIHKSNINKTKLKRASKHYKQTMNTYLSKHRSKNERKLRAMSSNKPKDYWRYLNSINKKDKINTPSVTQFFDYFKGNNIDLDQPDHSDDYPNIDDLNISSLNRPITDAEINKCIMKTKNGKACSNFDQISNEYLKATRISMVPIFTLMFNSILNNGILPDCWLVGSIKPIFKNKGSSLDPANYRPITILSCLGKIFTAVLNNRITEFLEKNNLLSENQAGFRAGYSTLDHIFSLNFLIEKIRAKKKKVFCSFIDFSSAFDSLWRAGLWRKLFDIGIKGKIFNVIRNMYSDIKSCISVNDQTSALFPSLSGVRQGENLSPILFSIYLNDIESFLDRPGIGVTFENQENEEIILIKIFLLLYADDTIIISEDENSFRECLNNFYDYCETWKLNINYTKTKVIVFGTNKPENYTFYINGKLIETVKDYKYLGVVFASSGSFLMCRKHIVSQANKAMHLLYQRIFNLNLPIDLQIKLFDHTILPILTYGCEVWGYENIDMLEIVHINFLRKITKSKKSTPRYMLYAELGRYPIEIIQKTRMIKFWTKFVKDKQSKITVINSCYTQITSSNGQNLSKQF